MPSLPPSSYVRIVASPSAAGEALQAARTLAGVSAGSSLAGTVVGKDAAGHLLLRHAGGTLNLQTELPLEDGSRLELRIEHTGKQLHARVLTINGKPLAQLAQASLPQGGSGASARADTSGAAAGQSAAPSSPEAAARTAPRDTVTLSGQDRPYPPRAEQAARTSLPPASGGGPLQPGSRVQAAVTTLTPDASQHFTAVRAPVPTGQVRAGDFLTLQVLGVHSGKEAAARSAQGATPAAASPDKGGLFGALGRAFTGGAASQNAPTPALPSGAFTGTVTHMTAQGAPVASSPFGSLTLPANAGLQPGAVLQFSIAGHATPPPAAVPALLPGPFLPTDPAALLQRWETLERLVQTLMTTQPALASSFIERSLPQMGGNLGSSTLAFLQILGGGSLRAWLGPELMDQLESLGYGQSLARLGEDFAALQRLPQESAHSPWQTWLTPLYDGEQVRMARWYVRRPGEEDGGRAAAGRQKRAGDTRFIVEVTLSGVGELQLDGLVQAAREEHVSSRRFDLVLRSEQPLTPAWRTDILALFSDTLSITGMSGQLAFQVADTFPIRPADEVFGSRDGVEV